MPRNVMVTFDDGSTHVYQNVPDDATPDQVTARASQEFGKQITALDGGRQQLGSGEPHRGATPGKIREAQQAQDAAVSSRPKTWFEHMFPELAPPTSRLDPLEAQNQGTADAGAALINFGADSTVNLPGQFLGFGAKVAGQVGRNIDPSIDPSAWRQAVAQRTTIPTTQRGQEVMSEAVDPAAAAWERNVSPLLTRYPALGAAAETAGTALEGVGWAMGIRGASRAAKGAIAEAAARPKVSYPKQAGVGTVLKDAPSIDELKALKNEAYKKAENTGVVINSGAVNRLKVDLVNELRKDGLTDKKDVNSKLYPKTTAALEVILGTKGKPSLTEIENLRKVAKTAADSVDKADARLGAKIIDAIDDFEDGLGDKDVIAGNPESASAFKEARALNSRYAKASVIKKIFDDAEVTAGANYTMSGMENALRQQFKALAKNDRKLRGFSADEKAAIRKVAIGGPVENALRLLGKFAPTGVVPTLAGLGAISVGGPAGFLLPAAGTAGRYAATRMTIRNAEDLDRLVRRGSQNFVEKAKVPTNE